MTKDERERIISLVKREVVPAVGCTEPIAVALCVAKATETLGCLPETIEVWLSANILKNAMGVGIPNTGMIGLPIAIALGAICGKSEYQLEVLKDADTESVAQARQYLEMHTIDIKLKDDITEKLYIEIVATAGGSTAKTIISGSHTNFVYIEKNKEILHDTRQESMEQEVEIDADGNIVTKPQEPAGAQPSTTNTGNGEATDQKKKAQPQYEDVTF